MPTAVTALCDATILTGEAAVERHALLLQGGLILDIARQIPAEAEQVPCPGLLLVPGLVDAQVNGGGNVLFNAEPAAATALAIAAAHMAAGTTSLLPTVITDRPEVTRQAIAAMRDARRADPGILGIHIEGPHISVQQRGVHSAAHVRALTEADLDFYRRMDDEILLMTVAPESISPQHIATLRAQGVIVSLGHTAAAPADLRAALAAGATGFTHLFNGMGGLAARAPGVPGIALDDRDSWCGLIADGFHVADEMIRLALRAKPVGKVFLVSDAMPPAAAAKPESFRLYDEMITVSGGQCHNAEGRFAGSARTLADCVRYCVQTVGVEIEEALRMASTYPAAFLGVGDRLGKLLPGFQADVIAFDYALNLQAVWRGGVAS